MPPISITELLATAQQLAGSGQASQAAVLYRTWLERNPGDPLLYVIYFNYGVLLSGLQDRAGAAQAFQDAIRLNPGFLPPFINLGLIYNQLGATEPALSHWTYVTNTLAAVTGENVAYKIAALKQMAQFLQDHKRLHQAEEVLRQLIELDPRQRDVVQRWIAQRQQQCRWPLLVPVGNLTPGQLLQTMAPLTLANYRDDPVLQLATAYMYSRQDVGYPADFCGAESFRQRPPAPDGRLRIGYLSSDLRNHAIGHLTAEMFGLHDRSRFEIFVYYCGIAQDDAIKLRIRDSVEHWLDITPLDDDTALRRMQDDGIDILIDINGHTRGSRTRLLSRRPAPVIVNWLGFAGTMGSPYHHYIIADEHIIPPGHEKYFSETVLRLPCYQPNDRHRVVAPAAPSRAMAGLPENAVVYCCFNGPQKITPVVFDRWMEILRQVPDSVLWLLGSPDETNLLQLAEQAGVAPDRLIFAPFAATPDHMARYALADLFLDTAPYGAHTTASDALWMGVPVLTLPGRGFASRVCASLVHAAGLPELVCSSAAHYLDLAITLGRNRARLTAYRTQLLASRHTSLLFDTPCFVRHMEGLFETMWGAFRSGTLPQPDLTNLEVYHEIGLADAEGPGDSTTAAYEARYRRGLAKRHAFSPLPRDTRLWQQPDGEVA